MIEKILWKERETKKQDPVEFALEHHPNKSRGQIKIEDHALYEAIRRRDRLDELPLATRFQDGHLQYYTDHYDGMSREDLRKVDHSLYQRLRENKLLHAIPSKNDTPNF